MKAYFVLVSVLAICPLAGCLSPEEQFNKSQAAEYLEQCLDSPEVRACKEALSGSKYLKDSDINLAKESLREAEREAVKGEQLRLEKVKQGQIVVNRMTEKVNYYQDNCRQTVISRNIFGEENIWETCVGDDLLSGLFGTWGKVNSMFLSNEIWESLDEKERDSLKEWLKEKRIRQLFVGRVIPSYRFSGNTITIDKTVWENL